jgi:hypothetical protein
MTKCSSFDLPKDETGNPRMKGYTRFLSRPVGIRYDTPLF